MNDPRSRPPNDVIETLIRAAFDASDYERAVTLVIENYGTELLGFLVTQMRDVEEAADVFADFSEEFWKSLPTFEWRCSARTWAYMLARRSANRHRRRERKHGSDQPLTRPSRLAVAVERARTATVAHKRTDTKDQFQKLREKLDLEDQTLLILRVDRGLSWLELAVIMLGEGSTPSEQVLKTEAARLRKRFQHAKERLRILVAEAGLLET